MIYDNGTAANANKNAKTFSRPCNINMTKTIELVSRRHGFERNTIKDNLDRTARHGEKVSPEKASHF
jgi:hypothetical protein